MTTLLNAKRQFDQYAFQNDLPIPDIIDGTNGGSITLGVWQTSQFLGLYDVHGDPLYTTVWGYGLTAEVTTYPGPTILAYEGVPITVNWQNNLPFTGHLLPVDTSLHFAASTSHSLTDGFVPIVTHLHGGHNDSNFDGLPDQWFTQFGPDGTRDVGSKFFSSSMTYDNTQDAATLWYHDHALGITRLNVYAGLAGFYVLQDENRLNLVELGPDERAVLPSGDYDIGMAIQDRAFTKDGQLYYPAYKNDPLPGTHDTVKDVVPKEFYKENGNDAPSIVPEFFGDTILVNGMAWPKLDVAAGDYEFRLLNGSDSRFYVLEVSNPNVAVYLVGTDGGLLHQAVTISDGDGHQDSDEFLVLAPGDRVELVFDFSKLGDGDTATLLNVGPAFEPFKGLAGADDSLAGGAIAATADDSVGNIMQFVVDTAIDAFDATVQDKTVLVQNFVNLTQDANHDDVADLAANHVRKVGLFEGVDDYGRVTPMLGKAEAGSIITDKMSDVGNFGPLAWDAPTTEKPLLGSTEQWDMFNFTEDSHPIHLHLTQFQVMEKRHIDFLDGDENGIPDDTTGDGQISYGTGSSPNYSVADIWIGDKVDLRPEETGWQDTAWVDPHQMMSIVATFDKAGDYVWHCHILSHEDNEMMRPYTVVTTSDFDLFA